MSRQWKASLIGFLLAGVGAVGCGPSDDCTEADGVCSQEERRCSVTQNEGPSAVVSCNDGVSVDVWTDGRTDDGCYLVADATAPAVQCGAHKIVLNEPCASGFEGSVVLGRFPSDRDDLKESDRYSGAAFLLSQCTTIHGDLLVSDLSASTLFYAMDPSKDEPRLKAVDNERASTELSATTEISGFSPIRNLRAIDGSADFRSVQETGSLSFSNLERVGENVLAVELGVRGSVSLPRLKEIGGTLEITNNETLEAFPLPSLERVGQTIWVNQNAALKAVEIDELTAVGRSITITYSPQVQRVSFAKLESTDEEFLLEFLPALVTLEVPSLASVGGVLSLQSLGLESVNQFTALREASTLRLSRFDRAVTIDFPAFELAGDGISLADAPALKEVKFPRLTEAGDMSFWGQFGGMSITLEALTTMEALTINSTDGLEEIDIPELTTIRSDLSIRATTGFAHLRIGKPAGERSGGVAIGGNVEIYPISGLASFSAGNMGTIGGDLELRMRDGIGSLVVHIRGLTGKVRVSHTGLSSLSFPYLTQANEVTVWSNTALTNLEFSSLARVEGTVDISGNAVLQTLDFGKLKDVTGVLRIKNNIAFPFVRSTQICKALNEPKTCEI